MNLTEAAIVLYFAWCLVWSIVSVSSASIMLIASVVDQSLQLRDTRSFIDQFIKPLALIEEWFLGSLPSSAFTRWLASQHWTVRGVIYKVVEGFAVGFLLYWF